MEREIPCVCGKVLYPCKATKHYCSCHYDSRVCCLGEEDKHLCICTDHCQVGDCQATTNHYCCCIYYPRRKCLSTGKHLCICGEDLEDGACKSVKHNCICEETKETIGCLSENHLCVCFKNVGFCRSTSHKC